MLDGDDEIDDLRQQQQLRDLKVFDEDDRLIAGGAEKVTTERSLPPMTSDRLKLDIERSRRRIFSQQIDDDRLALQLVINRVLDGKPVVMNLCELCDQKTASLTRL